MRTFGSLAANRHAECLNWQLTDYDLGDLHPPPLPLLDDAIYPPLELKSIDAASPALLMIRTPADELHPPVDIVNSSPEGDAVPRSRSSTPAVAPLELVPETPPSDHARSPPVVRGAHWKKRSSSEATASSVAGSVDSGDDTRGVKPSRRKHSMQPVNGKRVPQAPRKFSPPSSP